MPSGRQTGVVGAPHVQNGVSPWARSMMSTAWWLLIMGIPLL
jgi:hypothetical protein